ncbi:MAG TPA: hypothetical protein VHV28_11895 [Solirubrobacteraceae bacterium]|nr:hypothetical protein [Solirubrobacteraceae bacterium]
MTYYRHEWVPFLRAAVALTRHAFGLPWPQTLQGAWLVLRANQLWAPFPDNDPDGARAAMQRFYALVKDRHGETFDPVTASRLEVGWWRVHREHQHDSDGDGDGDGDGNEGPLIDALAALYAYVYGADEAAVRPAGAFRAEAMRYSDRWVREGCSMASPLIEQERAALIRSYAALLVAVHRAPPA